MPELYPLVKKTANFYWSKSNQNAHKDILKDFMNEHAPKFTDAPLTLSGGEMNLEYYTIYNEYLKVFEDSLMVYIDTKLDASISEFYDELSLIKDDKNINDKKLLHFVNYLVASTDYASFYKIMIRAAKKLNQKEAEEQAAEAVAANNDAKAESKSSSKNRGSNESQDEFKSEAKKYPNESKSSK